MVLVLLIFCLQPLFYGSVSGSRKYDMGCECGKRKTNPDVEKKCLESARAEDLKQDNSDLDSSLIV